MLWVEIPGWPGYRASPKGEILSVKGNEPRILKPKVNPRNGFLYVSLQRDDRSNTRAVHVLVALAFLGPRPPGLQVRHGPGGKLNNAPSNLRYDTGVSGLEHHMAARTECDNGHPFTEDNLMWRTDRGKRYRKCRTCHYDAQARYQAKVKKKESSLATASGRTPRRGP